MYKLRYYLERRQHQLKLRSDETTKGSAMKIEVRGSARPILLNGIPAASTEGKYPCKKEEPITTEPPRRCQVGYQHSRSALPIISVSLNRMGGLAFTSGTPGVFN